MFDLLSPAARQSACLVLVAASGLARAVDIRDDVDDSKYRDLANQAQFASVGMVTVSTATGSGVFIGFGKGKAWLLTCRHVLKGADPETRKFSAGGHTWSLSDEAYDYLGDPDLALIPIVGLNKGDLAYAGYVNGIVSVPAALDKRTVCDVVGYGKSGTGSNPGTVDDGKKRAYTNVIDAYNLKTKSGQEFEGYATDFDSGKAAGNTLDSTDNTKDGLPKSQTSSAIQTALEGGADSGDSGGGMFIQVGSGWALAGIQRQVTTPKGYGSWTLYSAMDAETTKWIRKTTGIAAVPEPASLLGLGVGLAGFIRARRKRSR